MRSQPLQGTDPRGALAMLEDWPPGEAPALPKLRDRLVSNGANASDFTGTGAGEAPALSPSSFTLRSLFAGGSSASEAVAAGSGRSCPLCSEGEAPDAGGRSNRHTIIINQRKQLRLPVVVVHDRSTFLFHLQAVRHCGKKAENTIRC